MKSVDAVNVYIDTNYSDSENNGEFAFQLSPPIQVKSENSAYIFLKEFTMLNMIYNIREINNTVANRSLTLYTVNGGTVSDPIELVVDGRDYNGSELAGVLDAKMKLITQLNGFTCTFDYKTLKFTIKAPDATQIFYVEPSNLADRMKLNTRDDAPTVEHGGEIISNSPVDIYQGSHNLYFCVREVNTNNRVATGSQQLHRIAKIPILSALGGYIVYQPQSESVSKFKIDQANISTLTCFLMTDDLNIVDYRFTATLGIEVNLKQDTYKKQVITRETYKQVMKNAPKPEGLDSFPIKENVDTLPRPLLARSEDIGVGKIPKPFNKFWSPLK